MPTIEVLRADRLGRTPADRSDTMTNLRHSIRRVMSASTDQPTLRDDLHRAFDGWRVTVEDLPGGFIHEDGVRFLCRLDGIAEQWQAVLRAAQQARDILQEDIDELHTLVHDLNAERGSMKELCNRWQQCGETLMKFLPATGDPLTRETLPDVLWQRIPEIIRKERLDKRQAEAQVATLTADLTRAREERDEAKRWYEATLAAHATPEIFNAVEWAVRYKRERAIRDEHDARLFIAEQALTAAQAQAEALRAALERECISGVTAGANPQRDGTFSPPLWHMECRLCGARWSKQQKQQPREHPEHESRFSSPCVLAPQPSAPKES